MQGWASRQRLLDWDPGQVLGQEGARWLLLSLLLTELEGVEGKCLGASSVARARAPPRHAASSQSLHRHIVGVFRPCAGLLL